MGDCDWDPQHLLEVVFELLWPPLSLEYIGWCGSPGSDVEMYLPSILCLREVFLELRYVSGEF